jgi:hypothetical protein
VTNQRDNKQNQKSGKHVANDLPDALVLVIGRLKILHLNFPNFDSGARKLSAKPLIDPVTE